MDLAKLQQLLLFELRKFDLSVNSAKQLCKSMKWQVERRKNLPSELKLY